MRVAVVGNLVNVGYLLVKFLRRRSVEADLFLHPGEADPAWEDADINPGWIKKYGYRHLDHSRRLVRTPLFFLDRFSLLNKLSHYDVVQKVCGGFPPWELMVLQLTRTPYATLATGSDLRELPLHTSPQGRDTLNCFRKSRYLFLATPDLATAARELSLTNSVYLPHPIDTRKYHARGQNLNKDNHDLVFFQPSRLDWSYTGKDRDLTALKYQDRFIRAFSQYVKEGNNALAIIVDYGVDSEKTHILVKELGIEKNVEFIQPVPKSRLIDLYNRADVVVDQFGAGWFGLVTLEAMSCGKPVLAYVNEEYAKAVYPEMPPVLNARTEEEIYAQIVAARHEAYRQQMGGASREWIMKYHDGEKVIDKLIRYYEKILGAGKKQPEFD